MRFSILKKFLIAFLVLSLVPLFILAYFARQNLIQIGRGAVSDSKEALLENATSLLEARARAIARQVELFLETCEDDLSALSLLPFDPVLYLKFSNGHRREIWTRIRQGEQVEGIRRKIPLYREITYADPDGIERIRILEDTVFPGGRHVSLPFRGSFGREDYFNMARSLPIDETYVSRLMGRHVRKEEQLRGAEFVEDAVNGESYRGIIRFAAPVYREGRFAGVVSLALDHQHLMEYTQHVLPIGNHEVVFPSYTSGNYAFLFDDEGWIITHPKFWDIRGYNRETGRIIDPESAPYTEKAVREGHVPFNLFHVPFIHENYRFIAAQVLENSSGITETSSVGNIPRIVSYAPIRFTSGVYRKTGFFGGVTLGARTDTFYQTIDETASAIGRTLNMTVQQFILIIISAGVLVGGIAVFLARSFSEPIRLLNEKVQEVRQGRYDVSVGIHTGDEIESLGNNFQEMSRQLLKQQERILSTIEALEISKQEAVKERDFIRSVFSNAGSGLAVINREGIVTSLNENTEKMLRLSAGEAERRPAAEAFSAHPELLGYIENALENGETAGVDLELGIPGPRKYIELTVSHLTNAQPPDDQSILAVIRDITRRKQIERYLSRSDRLVSLGTLAAGVAHEIRNPLTGISLMLDDLHDRMTGRREDQMLMQRALEEIEKLENIITELLDFATQPKAEMLEADIHQVIENTVFLIKKQCRKQRVLLVQNKKAQTPPFLMAPEKMKQALLNILLNALNVMPEGGELHIDTFLREDLEIFPGGRGVEIRICDTGPGVNPADMDFIFDPFFTKNPKGSGLGLSITHAIIEEHKGKIMVDSKLGRGACFMVYFPFSEEIHGKNSGC